MEYEAVIGLEVHAQLLTDSKIFCGCSTRYGEAPNSQTCPVCLGLPGTLPVLNRRAVEFALKMGLATHCRIASFSTFARKNYFYPDLPKGYQISQYESPLCQGGWLEIDRPEGGRKKVRLRRIHLEEDAGKSIHDEAVAGEETLLDFNRCGVPLIEIVSEPDLTTPAEAHAYLTALKQILVYLEVCSGNMEEGSLRCDANISVRPVGQTRPGTRTELKNLNSFRNVERALAYEIERQIDLLKRGEAVQPDTLLWDAEAQVTRSVRSKEEAPDYRYFPEPDLVPLQVDKAWVERLRRNIPELPEEKKKRFRQQYNLNDYAAGLLTSRRDIADYFEAVVAACRDSHLAANWILREVLRVVKDRKISLSEFPVSPEHLAELLRLISDRTLSQTAASAVFEAMLHSEKSARALVEELGLRQVSDREQLAAVVEAVLAAHPEVVEQFRAGKAKVLGFLVGQVMRATAGKADPVLVNRLLQEKLKSP